MLNTDALFFIEELPLTQLELELDDGCEACQHCLLWRKMVLEQIESRQVAQNRQTTWQTR